MPLDDLVIAGYWGNRQESADSCGKRLRDFLHCISDIDRVFKDWFEEGTPDVQPESRRVFRSARDLAQLLSDRTYHGPTQADYALGYKLSLWSEAEMHNTGKLTLLISCGINASTPQVSLPNAVAMRIPQTFGWQHNIIHENNIHSLISCLISYWDVDWATSYQADHWAELQNGHHVPIIGWITALPFRPSDAAMSFTDGNDRIEKGRTIITTRSGLSEDGPSEYVKSSTEISRIMIEDGTLMPMRYWE